MKKEIKVKNAMYPMLQTIIGAIVNGKPNFIAIAHVGILSLDTVSLGIHKSHYTNSGIIENKGFSVNIPDEKMVVETDYVGLVSGKNIDKSKVFQIFYGTLKNIPMISEAPVNMECELVETLDYKTHDIFVGRIVKTYADENVLTDDKIDSAKVKPMFFDMHLKKYWKLGEPFSECWSIGNNFKK